MYVSIKNATLTPSGRKRRVCVNQPDGLTHPRFHQNRGGTSGPNEGSWCPSSSSFANIAPGAPPGSKTFDALLRIQYRDFDEALYDLDDYTLTAFTFGVKGHF